MIAGFAMRHEYRIRKQYIELNPVKARLAEKPSEYPLRFGERQIPA